MAISANDIRKGMVILHEGAPVKVMEFHHHTPGNLRAMVQARLRNLLTGKLSGYKGERVFLVRVRDGQTLKVETIARAVSVWIEVPPGSVEQDLAADCHGNSEITPTTKGDYKLTVQECQKADPWHGTFKVRVTVR